MRQLLVISFLAFVPFTVSTRATASGNADMLPGVVGAVGEGMADYHIGKLGTREVLAENGIGSMDSPGAKRDQAMAWFSVGLMVLAVVMLL